MKTDKEQEPAWARMHGNGMPQVAEWDRMADIVHLCGCGTWTTFCRKCDNTSHFQLPPTSWTGTSNGVDPSLSMRQRAGWSYTQADGFGPAAVRAVSMWSAESDLEPELASSSSHALDYHSRSAARVRRRLASRSMCSLKPRLRKSISNMKLHMRKYSV